MNKIILSGRLARDPEIRYSKGERVIAVARYTLAVERDDRGNDGTAADFIHCVTFGK
ncbi:MAG: single-stranded DNA-binding protein, partial [Lachnospiraceae bacterium]|nr:single-stranded DNA-binding protein [Lachnospiraceae bacterium]